MPSLPDKAPLLKDDMRAYLYVAVTDTGPGLTPKELDMLFQRFSQVSRESLLLTGWIGLMGKPRHILSLEALGWVYSFVEVSRPATSHVQLTDTTRNYRTQYAISQPIVFHVQANEQWEVESK